MSKKKLTEKVLLEGMTPYNTHSDLLAKTETKTDWMSFADEVELVTHDFMTNRNEVFDEPSSDLVNPDIFLSNLKLALDNLPDGDIELCDLGNEIGRIIANLNSPNKTLLREVIYGVEHGFDLVSKERGSSNG
ncbi:MULTISPECIES: hypothetical protein [Vibrio]|uniref:hypothetical protein n=1 Tax=Vibrio TaxID=662 RepID=UPI000E64F762|nr:MULTISPECIES: hypothetical protein [Vibrio]EGQ8650938.1 hypothetical protein [Vibrio cholerae]EGR0603889.1 hypothetical protein [Vibrio cholerae]EGR2510316.1 hypothetical protein [Vibrio cholerae]EGR4445266.1 hypothetical protein [Vibrio cholerae]EGZ6800878.1 hypothetical protein [Vibrio cholerae]